MRSPEIDRNDLTAQQGPYQFSVRSLLLMTAFLATAVAVVVHWRWPGAMLFAAVLVVASLFCRPRTRIVLLLAVVLIALLAMLIEPLMDYWFPPPRPDRLRNLSRLVIAMHLYHQDYGCFPPAYVADANGTPMHSWRVLLLPYLNNPKWKRLYEEYRFNEPWDGPNNRRLIEQMPDVFTWHSNHGEDDYTTGYVVVVGEETAFPGEKSRSMDDLGGPAHKTILVVQCADSGIVWTEPRDLRLDNMTFRINDPSGEPGIRDNELRGACIAFAEGYVHVYWADTDPQTIKKLLTVDDPREKSDPP